MLKDLSSHLFESNINQKAAAKRRAKGTYGGARVIDSIVYAAERAKEERQAIEDKARREMTELRKELADLRRDKVKIKDPAIAIQIQEKNSLLQQLVEEWPTKTQLEKRKALESQWQSQSSSKRVHIDLTDEDDGATHAIKEEDDSKDDGVDDGVGLALKAYEALQLVQLQSQSLNTNDDGEVGIL
jgi:hypothetical protein